MNRCEAGGSSEAMDEQCRAEMKMSIEVMPERPPAGV
jgi:hypothetical protein